MNTSTGILLKVCSVVVFIMMFSCIKATSDVVPTGEAVFFRSFFALPPLFLWLYWRGDFPGKLATKDPVSHFFRGFMGVSAMGLGFFAVGYLPLPEVVAIGYVAPILVTIFAAMFLGEKLRVYRLSAIALGLVGVIMILSPRFTTLDAETATHLQTVGALAALMAAIFSALAQVFVRGLVQREHTGAIVFYFSITSTLLSFLTLPYGWVLPTAQQASLLIAAGLLGGVGQILLTASYRYAEVAVIAPFEYSSMLFALVIGYTIFGEVPSHTVLAGAALVIIAGIIIVYRERQLQLKEGRARARAAAPTQN